MPRGPANPERSFGLSVGSVLIILAATLAWRGRTEPAGMVGLAGIALLLGALLAPRVLAWPSGLWWRFVRVLGFANARVILTLLFAVVLVPLSALWRLIGRDPLARRRRHWHGWSPYPERYRDPHHYKRLY
jgi:hypothetical protein